MIVDHPRRQSKLIRKGEILKNMDDNLANLTLKECLYQTVHRNHKPLKRIAEEIGLSETYLTRAALPDAEESDTGSGVRFPLKKLIPLVQSTSDYTVLDYIEQSVGRVAFKLPPPSSNMSDACFLAMAAVKEFGHLMGEVASATEDFKISEREEKKILKEGLDAIQAIATLLHAVREGIQ